MAVYIMCKVQDCTLFLATSVRTSQEGPLLTQMFRDRSYWYGIHSDGSNLGGGFEKIILNRTLGSVASHKISTVRWYFVLKIKIKSSERAREVNSDILQNNKSSFSAMRLRYALLCHVIYFRRSFSRFWVPWKSPNTNAYTTINRHNKISFCDFTTTTTTNVSIVLHHSPTPPTVSLSLPLSLPVFCCLSSVRYSRSFFGSYSVFPIPGTVLSIIIYRSRCFFPSLFCSGR